MHLYWLARMNWHLCSVLQNRSPPSMRSFIHSCISFLTALLAPLLVSLVSTALDSFSLIISAISKSFLCVSLNSSGFISSRNPWKPHLGISFCDRLRTASQATSFCSAALLPYQVALTVSLDSSSVHSVIYWSILSGNLERVSVSIFTFPGRYLIINLKSIHLFSNPSVVLAVLLCCGMRICLSPGTHLMYFVCL